MAKATIPVIEALRKTAANLQNKAPYQWGHMGLCNCGNLAQVVTNLDKAAIHREAMRRHGDWNEQLFDYCPQSGLPFDHIIDTMLDFGFTRTDLAHLEKLSDDRILANLPQGKHYLSHNKSEDVIKYLNSWANLLENQLVSGMVIDKSLFEPVAILV
ncbi:hypothetical protein [uncultured Mucilaginibacter sp.]|uniref:hypothetical protein n=1 Tax=uncultured Mucilaginibacter sp. TaxID=797541 RepID=UPI0026357A98|nr:hypothetical protein [uncultured Mucilaginibacter sp.]